MPPPVWNDHEFDPARLRGDGREMRRPTVTTRGVARCLALTLVVTTGGCGYELRGAGSLPSVLGSIHVAGPPDIGSATSQLLDSGGINVEPTLDPETPVLRLSDERFSRRVLSVDASTGKAREFELAYQVAFRLIGADGVEMVPTQTVTLLRDYVFDSGAVLGKSREQRVLHEEMRRDAAAQIVRRIEAALES